MREILFRGKRTDNGAWVYGYLCKGYSMSAPHTFDGIMYENHSGINLAYMTAQIDFKTVGQYTGLTDKNGTKIFEGDIVRINNCSELAYLVFEEFQWVFKMPALQNWRHRLENNPEKYEMVGNIYDNPELLNVVNP